MNILKAYTGRIGCMCGCKGTYSYMSQEAVIAVHGAPCDHVTIDEAAARAIAAKVLAHPDVQFQGNQAFVETADTIDMVFFA